MSADGPFDSDYARDYAGFLTCQRGDLIAEYISRRKRWASQWSDTGICRVWLKLMGKRANGEPDDPAWVLAPTICNPRLT
jgi:hypothetical protein